LCGDCGDLARLPDFIDNTVTVLVAVSMAEEVDMAVEFANGFCPRFAQNDLNNFQWKQGENRWRAKQHKTSRTLF
jgi:hypothetical protein